MLHVWQIALELWPAEVFLRLHIWGLWQSAMWGGLGFLIFSKQRTSQSGWLLRWSAFLLSGLLMVAAVVYILYALWAAVRDRL